MPVAGKKQDRDCPFSLATTHVVITIFGKTLAAVLFAISHKSGSGILEPVVVVVVVAVMGREKLISSRMCEKAKPNQVYNHSPL